MKRYFRRAAISIFVGLLCGSAVSLFLYLLDEATSYRELHSSLIWGLPLAGLFMGWFFHRFGRGIEKGSNLIIEQSRIPARMAPFVLGGTLLTHLFGGSAGREGTAVQMGGAVAEEASKFFKIRDQERRAFLIAGAGSGFGAAIGAPWAGVLFGMEMRHMGPLRFQGLFESLIASWVAFWTTHFLKAPHTVYPSPQIASFSSKGLWVALLAGIVFGILAGAFSKTTHALEHLYEKRSIPPSIRPFLGGTFLVIFYTFLGTTRYAGLGIEVVQDALLSVGQWKDVFWKFILTVITIGSGFKGGEFIPLVFMGTCLGSALSQVPFFSNLSFDVLGALGFAAVFGAASNTPLACSIMAMELFGPAIGPYAVLSCFVAYEFSGHRGIYKAQAIQRRKLFFLKRPF